MSSSKKVGAALWITQGALAALFLFAGAMKLVTPLEVMLEQLTLPLPGWFVQFIGVCEVLGAFGLVLPSIFRIRPLLTPLASYGLGLIMVGATILTAASGPVVASLVPLVVGILAAFVAYGRRQLAPLSTSTRRWVRRPVGTRSQTVAVAR